MEFKDWKVKRRITIARVSAARNSTLSILQTSQEKPEDDDVQLKIWMN